VKLLLYLNFLRIYNAKIYNNNKIISLAILNSRLFLVDIILDDLDIVDETKKLLDEMNK
jgi:hypothetical protein